MVIRHNTFDHAGMANHGADTSFEGTRHWELCDAWGDQPEIYMTVQNITRNAGPYSCWTSYPAPIQSRGNTLSNQPDTHRLNVLLYQHKITQHPGNLASVLHEYLMVMKGLGHADKDEDTA